MNVGAAPCKGTNMLVANGSMPCNRVELSCSDVHRERRFQTANCTERSDQNIFVPGGVCLSKSILALSS